MKFPSRYRYLAEGEVREARRVYKSRIPYHEVVVTDGLGGGDRPFTLPVTLKFTPTVGEIPPGKYLIHVGDNGYYGMSARQEDKNLLIHELAHVWQGEHRSHRWDYVLGSLWDQALSDDAYAYKNSWNSNYNRRLRNNAHLKWHREWRLLEWDDYGPEQQASIIEDWYRDGMHQDKDKDLRFYYIKKHVWGEKTDYNWLNDQYRIEPLEEGSLPDRLWAPRSPPIEPKVQRLLERRYTADEKEGLAARVRTLSELFGSVTAAHAQELRERLRTRRAGDRLSELFHGKLATATRERLLRVLAGVANG